MHKTVNEANAYYVACLNEALSIIPQLDKVYIIA